MTDRPILNSAPLVATPEMIQAALDLVWENSETHGQLVQAIWQSMHKASPEKAITTAAYDVLQERKRQIEIEGWTHDHDDQHTDYSLAKVASVYAATACVNDVDRSVMDTFGLRGTPSKLQKLWPPSWDISWLKPKSRRADLVKSAALILAEIDRLDREKAKQEVRHD